MKTKVQKGLLALLAISPMTLMAQTTSTGDISEIVEDNQSETKSQKIEKIEVTGSFIKRVDVEGPQAVQTLDKEYLEKTGYNSLGDVLRDLSANSFGSFREQSGSSVAGGAFVNLRGLGANRTLVLMNGRRLAKDGIGAAPDLNLIPMSAIQRVDVLKDSSSATYGSDALGGVINVITKKDFDGAEFNVRYEAPEFEGGVKSTVSATYGKATNRGNFMFTAQYRDNSRVFSKDREWTRDGSSTRAVIPNVDVDANDGVAASKALPSCPADQRNEDDQCLFNPKTYSDEVPAIEQFNALSSARYEISESIEVYGQASATRKKTLWQYAPGAIALNKISGVGIDNANLPGHVAGTPINMDWRGLALGNRETEVTTDAFSVNAGAKAFVGDSWEVDVYAGMERIEREESSLRGYARRDNLTRDIQNGTYDPFNNTGTLSSDVAYTPNQLTESRIDMVEVRANGEIFEMPAGAASLAVGSQFTYETFKTTHDEQSLNDNVAGGGAGSNGFGYRRVYSGFTEIALPITEKAEIQIATRYDHYSDFGSTVNPKASFAYRPTGSVLVRGSAGTGFKAPDMQDIFSSGGSYPVMIDRYACANGQASKCQPGQHVFVSFQPNKDLKEEKSTSYSLGTVVQPAKSTSLSLDFFQVEIENIIGFSATGLSEAQLAGVDLDKYGIEVDRSGNTAVYSSPLLNIGTQLVRGVDFGVEYGTLVKGVGSFNFKNDFSYLFTFESQDFPELPARDQLGTNGAPSWRNNLQIEYGPTEQLKLAVNLNTTAKHQNMAETADLSDYTQVDTQVSYAFSKIKGKLTVGARNVLGTTPPLDITNTNDQLNTSLYDPIGRRYFAAYRQSF